MTSLNDKILEMENILVCLGLAIGWHGQKGRGYNYTRATGGTLMVMELFNILTTICMRENCIVLNTQDTQVNTCKTVEI